MSDADVKTPAEEDEEFASGSTPDPEEDNDVDEMYKKVFGHEPKTNISEEVEEAEESRRGKPAHEDEK